MNLSIQQITSIVGGDLYQRTEEQDICHIWFDTRIITQKEKGLFVALNGVRDGHSFINQAINKGITTVLVSDKSILEIFSTVNVILVEDTLEALQCLAKYYFEEVDIDKKILITGSYGKTIIKEWLVSILNKKATTYGSPKSYNSQIGVPISILRCSQKVAFGVFEIGVSMPDEMTLIQNIVGQAEMGVLTNIGNAHLEAFENTTHLLDEKIKLFKDCEQVICPHQPLIIEALKDKYPNKKIISWGTSTDASLCLVERNGNKIVCTWKGEKLEIKLQEQGIVFRENTLTLLTILLTLGWSINNIAKQLSELASLNMRYEVKPSVGNSIIINDAYSADLVTLEMSINYLESRTENINKTLVLSDFDLSPNVDLADFYRKVKKLIQKSTINRIIGIGEQVKKFLIGLPLSRSDWFESKAEAEKSPIWRQFQSETVLFKGARKFKLETLYELASLQLHDTTLSVDLTAMGNNKNYLHSYLKPTTKMMAMVKANAYGCGAVEVASFLETRDIDYLAVAYEDEGIELRNHGIKVPIMVMNPEINSLSVYSHYDLEPQVYKFELLEAISRSDTPINIHIKLETGMNRLGFNESEIRLLGDILSINPQIKVQSIFTHLAASDISTEKKFTHGQVSLFTNLYDYLVSRLNYSPIRHVLNSAGIINYPEYQFDMVRGGIALYGVNPTESKNVNLDTVICLKAKVSQIKNLDIKDTIGYGRTGNVDKKSRIATINIGYADGLRRALSQGNWGVKTLNNQWAPIIGRICMDMTMVDVTNISVAEGDEVVVIGSENSVEKMAKQLETIPYEILVSISKRIKRIYLSE